ncbi:hypothetical protein BM536_030960 [Streptomyces phaeoluteigriseus]|uniref:Uncharacterized protein n=1 Tax=Streptomyces phaeoluteigriseus TaxID=114686 RepID=A0A1V6MJD4_9ACTN|nr:hypothetical protein BM536_030960 [Streptomyces phaeoluteigriseus]
MAPSGASPKRAGAPSSTRPAANRHCRTARGHSAAPPSGPGSAARAVVACDTVAAPKRTAENRARTLSKGTDRDSGGDGRRPAGPVG